MGILGGAKLEQSSSTTKITESSSVVIVVHSIVKPHILIQIETFCGPGTYFAAQMLQKLLKAS